MLSAFCLKHGAAHVTALEVNREMAAICRRTLKGQCKDRYTVVCGIMRRGRTRGCFIPSEPFDILVSELLGTLATSESMFEHTQAALPHLTRFDGKVYTVPQRTAQYVAVYNFGESLYSSSSAPEAIRHGLHAVLPVPDSSGDIPLTPTNDCGLTLPVHLLDFKQVSEQISVREEVYQPDATDATWQKHQLSSCQLPFLDEQAITAEHFLITEWEATLFEDIVLRNTLRELQAMSARNAAARHAQWGFMLCRIQDVALKPAAEGSAVLSGLKARIGPWKKGIPHVCIKAGIKIGPQTGPQTGPKARIEKRPSDRAHLEEQTVGKNKRIKLGDGQDRSSEIEDVTYERQQEGAGHHAPIADAHRTGPKGQSGGLDPCYVAISYSNSPLAAENITDGSDASVVSTQEDVIQSGNATEL